MAFFMLKAHQQKYYDPRNVSSTISKQYLLRFSATKTTSRSFRFVDMWAWNSIKAANDTQPLSPADRKEVHLVQILNLRHNDYDFHLIA